MFNPPADGSSLICCAVLHRSYDRSDAPIGFAQVFGPEQPPLFIGHYWCEGIPALPTNNIACLDYSAVKYGRLVAYRWSGEALLNADHFVWIKVPKEERALPKPWEIDLD